MSSLKQLATKLLQDGPTKREATARRVRGLFDGQYILDSLNAEHVWETRYYPQLWVPARDVTAKLSKEEAVDSNESAYICKLQGATKTNDRILSFEKGALAGMVRFEFASLDAWFEEDQKIFGHPKDPYKRVDILPSSRSIEAKVDGVTIAKSSNNMFLYETGLRTRYYLPLAALNWQYLTDSDTTTVCPYKGVANYYNVKVNGKEHKDLVWWYKTPTHESALIAGYACFYNEKLQILVDGVEEKQ